tara:strand:- start:583 stop:870 length:288 start_codon:yes stop_codon:yes gene_type:complete
MSVVAYTQPVDMSSYRSGLPQSVDPLAHLYNLEREMENAERRTASMIDELARRLDSLEMKVSTVSENLEGVNRELEQKVVALARRVNSIENGTPN